MLAVSQMHRNFFSFYLLLINTSLFFKGIFGSSNLSFEHQIREQLLTDYDKQVRPVLGNKTVEVSFSMKISRLVKVVSQIDEWQLSKQLSKSAGFASAISFLKTFVTISLDLFCFSLYHRIPKNK